MFARKVLILTALLCFGVPSVAADQEYCHTLCYTDYGNLQEGFFWGGEVLFNWGGGKIEKQKGFRGLPDLIKYMANKGYQLMVLNTGNDGTGAFFSFSVLWVKK